MCEPEYAYERARNPRKYCSDGALELVEAYEKKFPELISYTNSGESPVVWGISRDIKNEGYEIFEREFFAILKRSNNADYFKRAIDGLTDNLYRKYLRDENF